jgi:VIT1/CCC1 family predicted Fe2+/Mn2+ transporter
MLREGYLRNFIFGVEDSLVSTVGFVSGIASASVERSTLLLAGSVLIFVEAFSMGVGAFLSEESTLEARYRRGIRPLKSMLDGAVMFVSYLAAGFLVLSPYALGPSDGSVLRSVALSLALLFLLGVLSARVARLPVIVRGFRMMVVGGLAIALGILVATFMKGV